MVEAIILGLEGETLRLFMHMDQRTLRQSSLTSVVHLWFCLQVFPLAWPPQGVDCLAPG